MLAYPMSPARRRGALTPFTQKDCRLEFRCPPGRSGGCGADDLRGRTEAAVQSMG